LRKPSHPEEGNFPPVGGRTIAIWFSIITIALALLLDYFMWAELRQDPLVAWLTAINLVALLTYVLEDQYRRLGFPLMPVSVFLAQAVAGGIFGAWLGTLIFHHEISRRILKRYSAAILVAQVIVVVIYLILF
jgi:uncharacterized membrane protein YsdA (DUF1294 family)